MRVLMLSDICGLSSGYHVGDEAMAEVAVERIKSICGAKNITLACANPKTVSHTYGVKSFAYYNFTDQQLLLLKRKRPFAYQKSRILLKYHLRQNDVLFICGGGNLTSEWPEVLESRLRIINEAAALGKKIILVSQTLGPYIEEHKKIALEALSNANWIGVRDKHFSHKQIPLKTHYAIDDASYLSATHNAKTSKISEKQEPYATFSMRMFGKASDELLNRLCENVANINYKLGLNTIFVSHHAKNGMGDSQLISDRTHFWNNKGTLEIAQPTEMAQALKAVTAGSNHTISMRYHQIIFSLSSGVPAIGIYVNEYTKAKLHGAFEQFGLTPKLISIDQIDSKLEVLVNEAINDTLYVKKISRLTKDISLDANLKPYQLIRSWAEKA